MAQTGIGPDYAGVGAVKITRDAWDPLATNDNERWKFIYNSKWSKDVRIQAVKASWYNFSRGFHAVEQNWDLYSSGTTSNATIYPYLEIQKRNLFGGGKGLFYQLPLFQSLQTDANGWYTGRRSVRSFLGTSDDTQVDAIREGTYEFEDKLIAGGATWTIQYGNGNYDQFFVDQPHLFNTPNRKLMIWNLPGDQTPIQDGAALPPVSGHEQVRLGESFLRVAKPGFNAATASGSQLSLDTSQVPAKILAAQDVLVPSGFSSVAIGYALPPNCVIDCHFYKVGDPIWYPSGPYGELIGAYYRLNGNSVEFNNPGGQLRARFIILASDDTPPTSGANRVLRQFNENGVDVVQFLRPGSGNPPSFADIALDSRWPAMQILAEGYLPAVVGTNVSQTVNYDAAGLFPFVKFVTVHGAGQISVEGSTRYATINGMIRLPQVTMWNRTGGSTGGWPGGKIMGGNTCICQYNDASATFITSIGDPMYQVRVVPQGGQARIDSYYDNPPIAGIRYYVFGIAI